jgi:hypothetical protein
MKAQYLSAAALTILLAGPANAQSKDDLSIKPAMDCKTSPNAQYCRNGRPREVCNDSGLLSWADNRVPLSRLDQNNIILYSPVLGIPPCSCLEVRKDCLSKRSSDCAAMFRECNLSVNSGGQFCLPNQWGGTTCYANEGGSKLRPPPF